MHIKMYVKDHSFGPCQCHILHMPTSLLHLEEQFFLGDIHCTGTVDVV